MLYTSYRTMRFQPVLHLLTQISRGKSVPSRTFFLSWKFSQPVCSFCCWKHYGRLYLEKRSLHHGNTEKLIDNDRRENKERIGKDNDSGKFKFVGHQPKAWTQPFDFVDPQLDWEFLCNPDNFDLISTNIANRKGVGDISKVHELWKQYQNAQTDDEKQLIWVDLLSAGLAIPNISHPDTPVGEESEARVLETHSKAREFDFKPKTAVEIGERLQMLRTDNLGIATGYRTYFFLGDLARLEEALVRYALEKIKQKGFQLVSVPDLVHPKVVDGCGFNTEGERTQVYRLRNDHGQVCLAGSAEMPLGGFFINEVFELKDLPQKVAAVSRCYRAETSGHAEEKGIYRVHQFTKVEMFGVTADEGRDESGQLLQEIVDIEKELFSSLGLYFRVLEMSTEDLAAPARRKFDIETWMPGRGLWGEISSASNCTDFQARRLNIRYRDACGNVKFAHTVNGTACAVPRMVIGILESNQQQNGDVILPEALGPWLGKTILKPPAHKHPFARIQDRKKK